MIFGKTDEMACYLRNLVGNHVYPQQGVGSGSKVGLIVFPGHCKLVPVVNLGRCPVHVSKVFGWYPAKDSLPGLCSVIMKRFRPSGRLSGY